MDAAYGLTFLTALGSRRWFNALAQEKTQHFLVDHWMFDAAPSVFFHPDLANALPAGDGHEPAHQQPRPQRQRHLPSARRGRRHRARGGRSARDGDDAWGGPTPAGPARHGRVAAPRDALGAGVRRGRRRRAVRRGAHPRLRRAARRAGRRRARADGRAAAGSPPTRSGRPRAPSRARTPPRSCSTSPSSRRPSRR